MNDNPIEVIVNTVMKEPKMQTALKASLPKQYLDIDRFTAAAVSAIKSSASVFADCNRSSVYTSLLDAARRGLMIDGKQGALVTYNVKISKNPDRYEKRCQFIIMPQGIIDSLARIGISIYAASVYQKDDVRFWNDTDGQHVDHKYEPFAERGNRIGAYAFARTRDGRTFVEAMSMQDISRVMASSKQKDQQGNMTGPWKEWPERMEQKSCLHRICKRLPSVEIPEDEEYIGNTPLQLTASTTEAPIEAQAQGVQNASAGRPKALQRVIDYDPDTGEIMGAAEGSLVENSGVQQDPGGSPF